MNKNCKLIKGDCLEVMKGIKDKSIDMILCDLPYGTTACKWDVIIPFEPLWEEYNRIIKNNGAIVLFGSEPFTSILIYSNLKYLRQRLIWKKHKPSNFACGKYMHLKYTEDIIIFSKNKPTYNPQMIPRDKGGLNRITCAKKKKWNTIRTDGNEVSMQTQYEPKDFKEYNKNFKYPSDILEFPSVVSNSKEKVNHPTQKPVRLLQNLIKTYTNEGMVVLDNCMGSGSTGVACLNTNRKFIGIEKDDNYFDIAKERIENTYKELIKNDIA